MGGTQRFESNWDLPRQPLKTLCYLVIPLEYK